MRGRLATAQPRREAGGMAVGALRKGWERLVLGSGAAARGRSRGETPEDVLSFWFGRPPGRHFELVDAAWLPTRIPCWGGHWANRLLDVDGIVQRYFGELHARACDDELDDWCATPAGRLALVILLDQLSRNIHRGSRAAFAQDPKALPIVEEALEQGEDQLFNPLARTLLYLPLMHHEDLALLDRCVTLYEAAYADATGVPRLVLQVELASGKRHREIVARFGRYPHRNEILGRASTEDERRFLTERFSSF
jgi:uncharacterized protein (DUF924 family)